MNLEASTGQNSANSPWSSLLSTVERLATTGSEVYGNVTGKRPTPAQQVASATGASATSTGSTWKTYLPWILGGAALLLAAVFIFRRS
jgi:hypothetical protein